MRSAAEREIGTEIGSKWGRGMPVLHLWEACGKQEYLSQGLPIWDIPEIIFENTGKYFTLIL